MRHWTQLLYDEGFTVSESEVSVVYIPKNEVATDTEVRRIQEHSECVESARQWVSRYATAFVCITTITLAFTSYNKLRNTCHIVPIFNGNQIQRYVILVILFQFSVEIKFNYFLSKDISNLAYITFCAFHQRIYLNHTSQFRIFVSITEYKRPRINLKTASRFELTPPRLVGISHNLWRHKLLPPPTFTKQFKKWEIRKVGQLLQIFLNNWCTWGSPVQKMSFAV